MEKIKKMLPSILMILLEIAVGVMLLIDYKKLTRGALIVFGVVLMICAVLLLHRYFKARRAASKAVSDAQKRAKMTNKESDKVAAESIEPKSVSPIPLVAAIVTFLFGAPFAFGAAYLMEVGKLLVIFYGAIMVVKGTFKIADYFSVRKAGYGVSVLRLIIGILSAALGVVLIIFPDNAIDTIFTITAISLLVEAALDLIALIIGAKYGKNLAIEAEVVSEKSADDYDDQF